VFVPQPFPYQGSKRRLASTIVRWLPRGAARLIEPFAGSAAVSLASAAARRCGSFWLNDLNNPLMGLWAQILTAPRELTAEYERLWDQQDGREREYYDEVRAEFNRTGRPELLLYLLARCVKASIRYNANGEFNQSPDNRRKGARPWTMRRHIEGTARLLAGRTRLSACDYREVLAAATKADVVYMDPPYQGVCGDRDPRYIEGVPWAEFVTALDALNRRAVAYIVSYDGRTGDKRFGRALPSELRLRHVEVDAGRSSQATLLGVAARTFESLYLSPALLSRTTDLSDGSQGPAAVQLSLFGG
jgi:DNA adenine methylase